MSLKPMTSVTCLGIRSLPAHAVVRAVACFVLWNWWPAFRFHVLPYTVSAIYLATVCAILVASSAQRQKLKVIHRTGDSLSNK